MVWQKIHSKLARWLQVDPLSSRRPDLSPFNYCQNNPLVRIDPTGMLDIKNEDNKEKKKNQQAKTLQEISDLANYLEKGLEMIIEGVSNTTSKVTENIIEGTKLVTETVLEEGPGTLNEISANFTYAGIITGSGLTATGNPKAGAAVVIFAGTSSTKLDLTATGLSLLNYGLNQTTENLNKFNYQLFNLSTGYGISKGAVKFANDVGGLIRYLTPYIIQTR